MNYTVALVHTVDAAKDLVLSLGTFQTHRVPQRDEMVRVLVGTEECAFSIQQITTVVSTPVNFALEVVPAQASTKKVLDAMVKEAKARAKKVKKNESEA
jgi:hypothetical protein